MNILNLSLPLLSKMINQIIKLDSLTSDRLKQFSGKVIKIDIKQLNIIYYLMFIDDGIELTSEYDSEIDTTISGKPFALLNLLQGHTKIDDEISISGNMDLAQDLKTLIAQMDIDWEEKLAKLTGDTIAHGVAFQARNFRDWVKQTHYNFNQNLSEYLQEESRCLVGKTELELFCGNVSVLHSDIDRMEAKINRIKRKLKESNA